MTGGTILDKIRTRHLKALLVCFAIICLMGIISMRSEAAVTTLTFTDLAPGTVVSVQYASRGVIFPDSPTVDKDLSAVTGTQVLRPNLLGDEWSMRPLTIKFTSGQSHVSLYAGANTNPLLFKTAPGTLRAYDATGRMVASDGPKPVAAKAFTTVFDVKTSAPVIVLVELDMQHTDLIYGIDDLTFEGLPPSPLPSAPPTVAITFPASSSASIATSSLFVQGTVNGKSLISPITLKLQGQIPADFPKALGLLLPKDQRPTFRFRRNSDFLHFART